VSLPKSHPFRAVCCSSVVALLIAGAARAQDADGEIETVVATGTRLRAPGPFAASSVVDAATIEARHDATVAELLTAVPGVYVSSPGSRGSVGSVFVRGGEANFTQVFIDGIQVNDPTNTRGGSFDFSALDIGEVARIEVVRGPLSSIYGSDALSGVINVVTDEQSTRERVRGAIDTGGAYLWRANMSLGGPLGERSHYGLLASSEEDRSDPASGRYRGRALGASMTFTPGDHGTLALHARHAESDSRAFPDASGGPLLAVLRDQDSRSASDDSFGFELTARRPVGREWQWRLHGALFDHSEQTESAGVVPGVLDGVPATRDDGDFRRESLGFFVSTPADARWQGAFGFDYRRESGASRGLISFAPGVDADTSYDITRAIKGLFAEAAVAASERLALSAAVRTDQTDSNGDRTTGKLAATYRLTDAGMRLRAAWGQGFKLPSLFSLGHPLVGNPALKPERAMAFELGVESAAASGGLGWQVNAFKQRFRDLIDFDFDLFMSVNRARVNVDGIEMILSYAREHWRLNASGTVLDVNVLGSSEPLNQRPEHVAVIGGEWRIAPAIEGSLNWHYVGRRYDSSIPTGRELLGSYQRMDLSLGWDRSATTRWSFSIDNVFDREYQSAIGFPDPGRVVRVGVRYRRQ
jgi:vitamin B12 transporter